MPKRNVKLFTVMICTLPERKEKFSDLMHLVTDQIIQDDLAEATEVIFDDTPRGEITTGEKRNRLIQRAEGRFCAFIDDDDLVSDSYVKDVVGSIKSSEDLDCIGFFGHVHFSGVFHGCMIHSTLCDAWTETKRLYYRPPNHLNPIKTEISKQIKFKDVTISEDYCWSVELQSSRLIKNEVYLGDKPLYFYYCSDPVRSL